MDPLLVLSLAFVVLSAGFLVVGVHALRGRSLAGGVAGFTATLLFLTLAALSAAIAVGTQGYRALTREEVAARVELRPTGDSAFRAVFHFPDSTARTFRLRGDQIFVDARILKWKPLVNVLGLHTAYELDRVGGRYRTVEAERTEPRTVFPLGAEKPLDVFDLRRRLPFLAPLVDASYGSGTYVTADDTATVEVRVSTSGLLVRRARRGP